MQKLIIVILIIVFFTVSKPLFAQGLTIENIKPKTATPIERKKLKTFTPQLDLPKPNNPLVHIHQNGFASQHRYPQAYLHHKHSSYYQFMDKQLLATENPKDLFIERLVETALMKLFHLD